MTNQLQLFTGAPTKTDRLLLALQRQAGKYPAVKPLIKKIKRKQSHDNWLAQ